MEDEGHRYVINVVLDSPSQSGNIAVIVVMWFCFRLVSEEGMGY